MEARFIADVNVGKLARWLRIMGYDTLLFRDKDDGKMVSRAFDENRTILTKDTHILKRRVATSGAIRVVLVAGDEPRAQIKQVVQELNLDCTAAFSRCLECNRLLEPRSKDNLRDRVPPYIFQTQEQYMECPSCHRIYWRGTHWQRMTNDLKSTCAK